MRYRGAGRRRTCRDWCAVVVVQMLDHILHPGTSEGLQDSRPDRVGNSGKAVDRPQERTPRARPIRRSLALDVVCSLALDAALARLHRPCIRSRSIPASSTSAARWRRDRRRRAALHRRPHHRLHRAHRAARLRRRRRRRRRRAAGEHLRRPLRAAGRLGRGIAYLPRPGARPRRRRPAGGGRGARLRRPTLDDGQGGPAHDEIAARAGAAHRRRRSRRIDARPQHSARPTRTRLGTGPTPLKYVIVATGNIYDDADQARAAAQAGADVIAVIRSTAQSLLDYVPHGATTEGYGGTYATQENFRIMRAALDDEQEQARSATSS